MKAPSSTSTVIAACSALVLSLGPPAWAGVVPPDAYNAATSTSGAYTGDDSLYADNPGFFSRYTAIGDAIISYKKITVTSQSTFWGVTGNAAVSDGALFDFEWNFTVDPADPAQATADPLNGSIANQELLLTDFIDRGDGFYGNTSQEYDLLLNPDGAGIVLDPGEYYVSVWTTRPVGTFEFLWTELSTTGVESDIFFADALHALGEFDPIQGFQTLGGQTMQTGDLAFDVWMTPVPAPGTAALLGFAAPFAFRRRRQGGAQ
ncbi:MAG: hypothetical protein ACF8MF_04915 [Phycisphaerales bacterium JB052]